MVTKVLTLIVAVGLAYVLFSIALENQVNVSTIETLVSPFWLCGVIVVGIIAFIFVGNKTKEKVKHAKIKR